MEALETSINYWEDALAAFSLGARGGVTGTLALTSPEEAEFCREIQDLLQNAYLLQVDMGVVHTRVMIYVGWPNQDNATLK